MVEGIVYKYTSPSGKCYIGQTIEEFKRRQKWYGPQYHYAGQKIDRARAKYGKDNFIYEVLIRNIYFNKQLAIDDLNRLETYYIGLYDSYNNGYNCTLGGDGVYGYKFNAVQRQAMRNRNLGKIMSSETRAKISKAVKKRMNTPEVKEFMRRIHKGAKRKNFPKNTALSIPVVMLTRDNKVVNTFPSMSEARRITGINNISAVLKGKRDTAGGYKWIYKT